jgi:hypothetical protein
VSLVDYHVRAGVLQAAARVLTPDGREAGAGEIRILKRHGRGADGSHRLAATFEPPAGLKPGEYLLLITLIDPGGQAESSAALFVVPAASGSGASA